ncbi:hypothetical protein L1D14_16840 [Vibrio tubiashii]|uniref:hypothetical protein n=1 Tax=Vibrio tubiashii TaxID=29498 RepID=UPI001EFDD7C6|nr:hypothetical protein [Vibrio tubiashii]MCG9577882.1 hypothetical protein [Vibrio tubiashii]
MKKWFKIFLVVVLGSTTAGVVRDVMDERELSDTQLVKLNQSISKNNNIEVADGMVLERGFLTLIDGNLAFNYNYKLAYSLPDTMNPDELASYYGEGVKKQAMDLCQTKKIIELHDYSNVDTVKFSYHYSSKNNRFFFVNHSCDL